MSGSPLRGEPPAVADITREIVANADSLYEFVTKYSAYMATTNDYGTGEWVSMVEVHLLTHIEENPGVTPTQLAKLWVRTKGAISQQVKKLEEKGLVEKRKLEGNAKTVRLYPTPKGAELSAAHKLYDMADITQTLQLLLKTCTIQEISAFYKVIKAYDQLLDQP